MDAEKIKKVLELTKKIEIFTKILESKTDITLMMCYKSTSSTYFVNSESIHELLHEYSDLFFKRIEDEVTILKDELNKL